MLIEERIVMIPSQPPICPNCGANMVLIEPDEFFETYAYCCDECGIRTKECRSPDEAYATIRQRPFTDEERSGAELDI